MSDTSKNKRLLAMGDLHAGSWCGLTPPHYDARGASKVARARYNFRRELWDWYKKTIEEIGPVDAALVNGDLVDGGSGRRSGGSEVIIPAQEQGEAAAYSLGLIQCTDYYLTYGTGYHTEHDGIDLEYAIAESLGGSIADRQFLRINDTIIKSVHHAGGGSGPGTHTYPARCSIDNKLLAIRGEEYEADILLFSHRHVYSFEGDATRFSMRLPCLQGPMTKFGRRCAGSGYTMGLVVFDFTEKGWTWKLHETQIKGHRPLLSVI